MRIAFYLSTLGGSPLQTSLARALRGLGHAVDEMLLSGTYDLLLVFNQCAHNPSYQYLPFPDHKGPIAFIDTAEYGYFKRLKDRVGNYWNAFADGSINHDTKNREQQVWLRQQLEGKSFPYFIREKSKFVTWPENYHPIDYPLDFHSVCNKRPNRDQYFKRDLDLFVSWGASHPWRIPLTEALRCAHVKAEIRLLNDSKGVHRMPQREYFDRTEAAKASVSFDGYGSGSFRVTEVLVRTLLLQGPLTIDRYAPLVDGVHCIEYQVESDGEIFLGTNVAQKLREALADPERSYRIYHVGYEHCMRHYTERATAEYVLRVVREHDWSKPTTL